MAKSRPPRKDGGGRNRCGGFKDVPGADAHDEKAAHDEAADEHVGEPFRGGGIKNHGPEVGDFGPHDREAIDEPRLAVAHHLHDMKAGGRLLPAIGDDDPDTAENRSEGDHAGGEEVHLLSDFVPTEDEHGKEAALQKKGEDSFRRQSAAEDIPHKAAVVRPIRAELKFHHDAGGHADGEVERVNPGPEACRRMVFLVTGPEVATLKKHEDDAHADREGREEIMKHDRECELKPRKHDDSRHGISSGIHMQVGCRVMKPKCVLSDSTA